MWSALIDASAGAADGDSRRLLHGAGRRGYGLAMSESVYNVIELIGTSAESWEKATSNAVVEAARSLKDLRVARVIEQDVVVEEGQVVLFRSKVRLSFKHEVAGP